MEAWEDIHRFWFGDYKTKPLDRQDIWFEKRDEIDAEIRDRFLNLYEQARLGSLDYWDESPKTALSFIILTDQFPRNMFRQSPRAFEMDPEALRTCYIGLEAGFDRRLSPVEKWFFYMPLMHSERINDQELCVSLFEDLAGNADGSIRESMSMALDYAKAHRDIILRFKRFPHRNEILGRLSSQDEIEFLKQPGSSF